MQNFRVLGIETSCDETGVAIYDREKGLLAERLYSQIDEHAKYGGVVPELASRDHIRKLIPLIRELGDAHKIDGVAYTSGPGLAGALLAGASVARGLAYGWGVPALGVHHMEGHLLAPLLAGEQVEFPFIALLVSGGHTQLVDVEALGKYRLLGESVDDAVGEAFDKTAKLLGLSYPGGPEVAKLATQGNGDRFGFPRPMVNRPGLDFSFSGLKTFVRTLVEKQRDSNGELNKQLKADIAQGFEAAVVDTLTIKCKRALKETGRKALVVAGGVSANRSLRASLQSMDAHVQFPPMAYCTDNGAMIAHVGAYRLAAGQHDQAEFMARPRWPLTELTPPSG